MPDVVGYRAKMAVIVPSTNTVVESDYNMLMPPPGITFHTGRLYIENPALASDAEFEALLRQLDAAMQVAVRDVLTCKPDHFIMGMSAGTFWGGVEGSRRFVEQIERLAGMRCSTGAVACDEACKALGVQRLAILTPYQPIADANVRRFFEEAGYDVRRVIGMKCPSATAIAEVDERTCHERLLELDGPDVDAIIQVGTNLSMVRIADAAERWLGKPVIAINAATLWHALRANGFTDRRDGFGMLLREH